MNNDKKAKYLIIWHVIDKIPSHAMFASFRLVNLSFGRRDVNMKGLSLGTCTTNLNKFDWS